MADQPDNPHPPGQLPPSQPLSRPAPSSPTTPPKGKFPARWAQHWIARLRTMPAALYRECSRRLLEGQSAASVARWLLTVKPRGKLIDVTTEGSMCRYMELLRHLVQAAEKKAKAVIPPPPFTPRQVRKAIKDDRRRLDNLIFMRGGASDQKPDTEPPRVARLAEQVKRMPEADRMLARHEFGLYRRILKLKAKLEQETKAAAPPEDEA